MTRIVLPANMIGWIKLSIESVLFKCKINGSSPFKIPDCSTQDTENIVDGNDDNNEADIYELLPVTKGSVLHALKKILSSTQPANSEV